MKKWSLTMKNSEVYWMKRILNSSRCTRIAIVINWELILIRLFCSKLMKNRSFWLMKMFGLKSNIRNINLNLTRILRSWTISNENMNKFPINLRIYSSIIGNCKANWLVSKKMPLIYRWGTMRSKVKRRR